MEINKIQEAADFIKSKGFADAEFGIVLGTGLGKLVHEIDIKWELEYEDIPNFPVSTVEFHSGKLIYGSLAGKNVLAMQGRFHLYEGYAAHEVVFPIRVMKLLGIDKLIVTNAAGGINLNFEKGDLVIIDDHINLLTGNPLIGKNMDELGPRFPDMSAPYSVEMQNEFSKIAELKAIKLNTGVYAAVTGPNLETRAEYRFLRTIGADLVGMSTVPEVIAANHMGMHCLAISIVTDICDPDNLEAINIDEIIANAGIGEQKILQLIPEFVKGNS